MPAGRLRAGRFDRTAVGGRPTSRRRRFAANYVAGLRRALEPGRAARTPATIVVTSTLGFSLKLADDALDVGEFAATIHAVHRRLSRPGPGVPRPPGDVDVGTIRSLRDALQRVLGSRRGEPFAELGDHHAVLAERSRLTGLRLVAVEDLALLRIALGEESAVAGGTLAVGAVESAARIDVGVAGAGAGAIGTTGRSARRGPEDPVDARRGTGSRPPGASR